MTAKLTAELPTELKKYEARRIAGALETDYLPHDLLRVCGYDFKTCSLAAYLLIAEIYSPHHGDDSRSPGDVKAFLGISRDYDIQSPLTGPLYLPVSYCGHIGWERIFRINRCAFSSSDSIIGIRDGDSGRFIAPELIRPLKGLITEGYHDGWTLLKLDPDTTDDQTAMLALLLEKNFHLRFAHFPHNSSPVILLDWNDC